jgi:uncharacterized protein (TIGR03083 family)
VSPDPRVLTSVENLAIVWGSVGRLCSGLDDAHWDLPTGCPGWTVKDNLSHLADVEARAAGRPAEEHDPGPLSHVKNELGRVNEAGVAARRTRPGASVLAEFREVTAERLTRLGALTEPDLAAPAMTPAGPGTMAALLTMRVMDSWAHEQDIRRAVGRPGHTDGPAVTEALDFLTQFLPYVVGKRAAAPEGCAVEFRIGARSPVTIEVAGGRGRVAAGPREAAVTLEIPVASYQALACGRSDEPGDVVVSGDRDLGRRVLEAMGITP